MLLLEETQESIFPSLHLSIHPFFLQIFIPPFIQLTDVNWLSARHSLPVCTVFNIYYMAGSMLSTGDTRMSETLVKVVAEPHANRPL